MLISEAPKAAETKSRREKEALPGAVSGDAGFLFSIACSLMIQIEKQNGRHIRAAGRQLGWTPLSTALAFASR
jgi:hypothetical protein